MEDIKSKIYLSWDEIDTLVDTLANKIVKTIPPVDSIMGLPRGGLIPAVMISHKLNLPLVFKPTKGTLIVDDICDSGETFIKMSKKYPSNYLICLHLKSHTTNFIPDICAEIYEGDEWLVYPWESKDADAIQDYLK
jgi:hypoxanthine phosphoribosyltransferase